MTRAASFHAAKESGGNNRPQQCSGHRIDANDGVLLRAIVKRFCTPLRILVRPERRRPDTVRRRLSVLVRLACAIAFCWTTSLGYAQQGYINREYKLKAAYLYNFGKYVSWPKEADRRSQDFVIGILGDSPVRDALVHVAQTRQLNDKRIVIKQFQAAHAYEYCHILYAPEEQDRELLSEILRRAREDPTLIVGETKDLLKAGGIIRFYLEGNRLKFEINPRRAEEVGLTISSKLLSLGRIVGS